MGLFGAADKYLGKKILLHSFLQDLWQRGRFLRLRATRLRHKTEHPAVLAAALRFGREHAGGATRFPWQEARKEPGDVWRVNCLEVTCLEGNLLGG